MSKQFSRRLAWSIAACSLLVAMIGLIISVMALIAGGKNTTYSHQFFKPFITITYSIVGALVASRHPRNLIGWMFAATGLLSALNMLSAGYALYGQLVMTVDALPGATFVEWLRIWIWIPGTLCPLTFLLLLFPDGQNLSTRWRPIGWLAGLGIVMFTVGSAFHPGPLPEIGLNGTNPFGIPGAAGVMSALMIASACPLLIGICGSIASVIVRFRASRGIERAQLKWLAFAGGIVVVGNLLGMVPWLIRPDNPFAQDFSIVMTDLTLISIVLAAGIAILRFRLWDINIVIHRTLVYGSLTTLVIALYVGIVGALGALLQTSSSLPISLVGTGMVAVLFQPLRERLQRSVNRLMYGERDDPYAVLRRLAGRLETVITTQSILPTIVETVAETLKLPYVAIALKDGDQFTVAAEQRRAASGGSDAAGDREILPLVYQLEVIGQMILAPRALGEPFSQNDRRLLETIARQAGIAAYNVRLSQDLQRSRERLVTTREEERRRLRRDLHDGLGPVLASMSFKLDAVHNLADRDVVAVRKMVDEVKTQTQAALADIRRIAYDLRPPALDELGLVGALKEHVASYNQVQGLRITLDMPESPPPLPAAVEVAAYRIALEAVTNVSRHAAAQHCTIRLSLPSDLCLEVMDDGRGLPSAVRAGVGLISMRERAEELGGTFITEALPQGGTGVTAHLPLSPGYQPSI